MAFEYDGKIYRNLEEQVDYNKDCINDLDLRVTTLENKEPPVYTPMDLDLNTGIVALAYDTTDGLSLNTQGTIKSNTGTNQVVVDYKIPIVAGDNILIDKKADEDKIEVKLDQSKDIKIIGGSTNSVYFTSDSSATFSAAEGTIYSSFGDESGIPRIRQKDPGGNRIYTFPTNAYGEHTVLTSKNVKTLFGKSIVGTGNINLYRHNICFTSTDQDKIVKIRFIVISNKNVNVNDLANLKTLLGNTFTYPVNGGTGDNKSVYEITETGYKAGATPYVLYDTVTAYPAGTWTDTVTTV